MRAASIRFIRRVASFHCVPLGKGREIHYYGYLSFFVKIASKREKRRKLKALRFGNVTMKFHYCFKIILVIDDRGKK
jgi:uncharacterized protein with von Willebrand factor type A (vWA) domain